MRELETEARQVPVSVSTRRLSVTLSSAYRGYEKSSRQTERITREKIISREKGPRVECISRLRIT